MKDRLKEKMSLVEFERVLGIHFIYKKFTPIEFFEKYFRNAEIIEKDYLSILNYFVNNNGIPLPNKFGYIYEVLEFRTFCYKYYNEGSIIDNHIFTNTPFITTAVEDNQVVYWVPINIDLPPKSILEEKEKLSNENFDRYKKEVGALKFYEGKENYQEVVNKLSSNFELKKIDSMEEVKRIIGNTQNKYLDFYFEELSKHKNYQQDLYYISRVKNSLYQSKFLDFIITKHIEEINDHYIYMPLIRMYDGVTLDFGVYCSEELPDVFNETAEDLIISRYHWFKLGFFDSITNYINTLNFKSRKINKFEEEIKEKCDYLKFCFTANSKIEDYQELLKYNYSEIEIEKLIWECQINEEIKYKYIIIKNKCPGYKLYQKIVLLRESQEKKCSYSEINIRSLTGVYIDLYTIYIPQKDCNETIISFEEI